YPLTCRRTEDEYRHSGWLQSCVETGIGLERQIEHRDPEHLQRRTAPERKSPDENHGPFFRSRSQPSRISFLCENLHLSLRRKSCFQNELGQEIRVPAYFADRDQLPSRLVKQRRR